MLYRPGDLRSFLEEIKAGPKRSLSQNFLIDGNIIKKIIATANISANDTVLEIGSGPGVLTEALLNSGANVIAIEKDHLFAKHLSRLNTKGDTLKVIEGDILKVALDQILPYTHIKVVANLPYNIASLILNTLFKEYTFFSQITIMLQKEVAQRITAPPGTKNYSSFTILTNFFTDTKYAFSVSRNCFYPRPKVDSAIVNLTIKEKQLSDTYPEEFFDLVRKCFQKRRKKLITTLKQWYPQRDLSTIFQTLDIQENARPENLSVAIFWRLFKKMSNHM